ncbi:MAG: hypothetical protein GY895_17120 [Phycisphaera sp.]|nr:hypothetical protein [Phycisphaera sp.]
MRGARPVMALPIGINAPLGGLDTIADIQAVHATNILHPRTHGFKRSAWRWP